MKMLLQALLDISDALSFIHSKGYTHFDVKPSNILMVNGKARLGDFSHCLRYVQGQEYERSMGTSAFMAPEIVSGAEHSGLEDMYSLGITMYALLMAELLPFEEIQGTGMHDKGRKTIRSLFIHPDLLSIIQRATACNPPDRYQTFEDFSKDISSFMDANNDYLDEKVPIYLSTDLRRPTVPPYFDASKTNLDLS
ncbi:MAG: protein kinase [Clostridia bacterium]|nr:protein kinase [Clostridia bacterium]